MLCHAMPSHAMGGFAVARFHAPSVSSGQPCYAMPRSGAPEKIACQRNVGEASREGFPGGGFAMARF